MKTLIVVTGTDSQILGTWLPSIRQRGKYDGDILFVDYDLLYSSLKILKEQRNITIKKTKQVYKHISGDRMRAFFECLKSVWQNYDVIAIMDGDLEFFKPLAPLFEMAKEKICYVKEPIYLHSNQQDNDRFHYNQFKFPDANKIWEVLKNEFMINVGMFVGPAKMIYDVLGWITSYFPYDSHWGADQVLFNALIYYYKLFPSQEIDIEWNWLSLNGYYDIGDGKCFNGIMDGKKCIKGEKEIAILHKTGTTFQFSEKRNANCKVPAPEILKGVKYSKPPKF